MKGEQHMAGRRLQVVKPIVATDVVEINPNAEGVMRYCVVLLEKEEAEMKRRKEQLMRVLDQYQNGGSIRVTPSRGELRAMKKADVIRPHFPQIAYTPPKNGRVGAVFGIRAGVNSTGEAIFQVLRATRVPLSPRDIAVRAEEMGGMQQHGTSTIVSLVSSALANNTHGYFERASRGLWQLSVKGRHRAKNY